MRMHKTVSGYCHDNGRPGTDPVVLIKMVLIQHLFGIPSLRQTHRDIQVNLAYRWFSGYSLLDMESIVPELKTMTEDEGKDFLYHIAKSSEAQEYLKKRAEGVEAR